MSFAPVTVTLLRSFERSGVLHSPGDQVAVPIDEAAALFQSGWACPVGAEPMPERRPIRGTFKPLGRRS